MTNSLTAHYCAQQETASMVCVDKSRIDLSSEGAAKFRMSFAPYQIRDHHS